MPEKRETLEQLAQREADGEKEREAMRARRVADAERLAQEVPARFFELARELREAVARFNGAALPERRLSFHESAALAAHDSNLNADFNCSLSRAGAEITLGLTAMGRSGRPDAYLIEASGRLGDQSFMLRAEGFVSYESDAPKAKTGGKVVFRISIDFVRVSYPIDELAERLVRSAVRLDRDELQA